MGLCIKTNTSRFGLDALAKLNYGSNNKPQALINQRMMETLTAAVAGHESRPATELSIRRHDPECAKCRETDERKQARVHDLRDQVPAVCSKKMDDRLSLSIQHAERKRKSE
jgi:hypothetical protein